VSSIVLDRVEAGQGDILNALSHDFL